MPTLRAFAAPRGMSRATTVKRSSPRARSASAVPSEEPLSTTRHSTSECRSEPSTERADCTTSSRRLYVGMIAVTGALPALSSRLAALGLCSSASRVPRVVTGNADSSRVRPDLARRAFQSQAPLQTSLPSGATPIAAERGFAIILSVCRGPSTKVPNTPSPISAGTPAPSSPTAPLGR